jgi:hypothetical protein
MKKTLWFPVVLSLALCVVPARAQQMLEFRGADTRYRFADWSWTSPGSLVLDLFYVGVPGSNEFNLGGGYAIRKGKLTVVPLVYAVLAREGRQRGVKVAVLALYEKDGWKLNGFLGHFAPSSGEVSRYQVLDTLDLTRTIGKRWEAGLSSGFFHTGDEWSPQVGPMARLNDRWGSWAASYRFGPQKEFRLVRILAF